MGIFSGRRFWPVNGGHSLVVWDAMTRFTRSCGDAFGLFRSTGALSENKKTTSEYSYVREFRFVCFVRENREFLRLKCQSTQTTLLHGGKGDRGWGTEDRELVGYGNKNSMSKCFDIAVVRMGCFVRGNRDLFGLACRSTSTSLRHDLPNCASCFACGCTRSRMSE